MMMKSEQEMKVVMEEVSKGRELALQLQRLLMVNDDLKKEQLAAKILDSFRNSLSILNSNEYDSHDHHRIHIIMNAHSESHHPEITTTTSTSTSTSNLPKAPPPPGRGRYKRRKCSDSDIRKKEHSTAYYDDGHAWRKYGQKIIHNNKFPRSYHRCTHKYDQGCRATKHIEMIQQNPGKYRTTYYGHHTCTSPQNHLHFLLESPHHHQSITSTNPINGIMLNFGSPITTFQVPQQRIFPSTDTVQVEDHIHVDDNDNDNEDEDEQLISQQQSPEYQLLPFQSDLDDNVFYSIDFTDLHDFLFS